MAHVLPAVRHGGRLARRLFGLFVLAAMLPLAMSDWLSQTALRQLADGLDVQHRVSTTRQVSRQVLDRLLAGHSLLNALPATAVGAGTVAMPGVAGKHKVFRRIALLAPDGGITQSATEGDDLPIGLLAAGTRWMSTTSQPAGLLMLPGRAPSASVSTWLTVRTAAGPVWLAELDADHLWGPVHDGGDDGAWHIIDGQGTTLYRHRGGDYPPTWSGPGEGASASTAIDTNARLFLGGFFHAGDWTFVQRSPRPEVRWNGMPLGTWLAAVALATLLAIAWLSRWQIRRTLEPLERLTDGTRRLAAGASDTRVNLQRNDEIGSLADAFNHMAERLEAQFDALAGLTTIDRQILQGASIEALVILVLRRLAADCAPASVCIAWLDGQDELHRAWLENGASLPDRQLVTDRQTLDSAMLADFLALTDQSQPAPSTPVAWWPEALNAGSPHRVVLPMALLGRTAAMVCLGVSNPADALPIERARELRDRLSVALASRARENELIHRAGHDSLTGLVNRHGLHQTLDAWLGKEAPQLAVLFVDLDHFKDVNDSRGHAAGDELLCQASQRLLACAPAGALVARQGGDEFALVLPLADRAAAEAVARSAVDTMARPFVLPDSEHLLGASIGIALCPADGRRREDLLRRADVALYAAKGEGRGRHRLFSADLDQVAHQRIRLLAELRLALERSEFVVHYQPRVLASDRSIRSAEALVRWQHPERGLQFPGAFIGMAESSGLIDGIGMAVLAQTCAQLARWRSQGLVMDRVSVNVSPQQLLAGDLPQAVRALLDLHGLPGSMLELEVTESLLVGDTRVASDQLALLRTWGITVALDDFGTGYSSMATLRQLPIDVMKVDRSFVTDVCGDQGAKAVTSAIIALAQSMNLHLVAEGIETSEQATLLGQMGCDELQGFLFSRALPAEQFEKLPGLRWVPMLADAPAAARIPKIDRTEAIAPAMR